MEKDNREKRSQYYEEWKECRDTIARFDTYILSIRTKVFAIFTLLAGGLFTAERLGIMNSSIQNYSPVQNSPVAQSSSIFPQYLAHLFFLSFAIFLFVCFLLDRYYEKHLLATVSRAMILEIKIHRLFGVGLSTGIENYKDKSGENVRALNGFLKSPSESVYILIPLLYSLVFLFVISVHTVFLLQVKSLFLGLTALVVYSFLAVIGYLEHESLSDFMLKIKLYRKLSSARILFTDEQIENRLNEICNEIKSSLGKSDEIVFVPVMEGADIITGKIKKILQNKCPEIKIREYPIHVSKTKDNEVSIKNFGYKESFFKNKNVLIIEDMAETGDTLQASYKKLLVSSPNQLKTFVLIQKRKSNLIQDFKPDYLGFSLEYEVEEAKNKWLFGYGMDILNEFRDCDYIAECEINEELSKISV